MGFFQKLFKRNNANTEETVEKQTIPVEVKDGKADVAPVEKVEAEPTTVTKTTTKKATTKKAATSKTNAAKTTTVTKQCAATTKAGSQCKRAPVGRSKFCSTHKKN